MTRKRTRESVEHVLCNECPTCHGRGTVKSVETVCYEIMREIVRVHHAYDSDRFLVYASPAVAETLKGGRVACAGGSGNLCRQAGEGTN